MTNFHDLPSPEQLKQVFRIFFEGLNTRNPAIHLTASYVNPENNEEEIHKILWPGDSNKITFSRDLKSSSYGSTIMLVLMLMRMATGHSFTKTDHTETKQIWERDDYLQAKE